MRTAAMLLCSVALALPALAQTGAASSGPPDQAQGPPPGGGQGGRRGGVEERLDRMTRDLSLTPDQVAKIKPGFLDEILADEELAAVEAFGIERHA